MKRFFSYVILLCLVCTLIPSAVFAEGEVLDNSHLITYDKPGPYDYYIDEDPMQISDEDFFGVWDKESQKWVSKPYFRYDEFPDMAKVKEAAQDGDYDLAKEELLTYYREVAPSRFIPQTTYPGRTANIMADALQKNVYGVTSQNGAVQGFLTVDNEWDEYRVDVKESFSTSVVGIAEFRGFEIMSVDKHLTQAEIYSRESEYPPQLELVVNGLPVTYTAAKDSMIRAGKYGESNFGNEEIMTIQESGYYQNFDDNTMRALIAFDISNLKTTDVVSSATLVLRSRNASGTGEKELFVYRLNDMSFDESTVKFIDYTDCMLWSCNDQNTWDYITPASTTLKGKACYFHRGNELKRVSDLYSYSGNELYAYTFIRQQMGLVNNVGFNLEVMNSLDISTQLANGTVSLMQVLPSKHMTGEILTAILKTHWLMADYEAKVYYGQTFNNWASFATRGVYSFLARFSEFAVFDEWMELTRQENQRLTDTFTFDDGMCIELSIAYQRTILSTLSEPYKIEYETGVPVPFTDDVVETSYKIVKSMVYCSSPGFHGYNIADGNDFNMNLTDTISFWYNMVFKDEPMFEYIATKGKSGEMPKNPTTRYAIGLRTYMRSSWEDDAFAMSFINTPEGSHDHNDELSVTMFAYGRFLLVDPAYGASGTDGSHEYMESAQRHNLVTVNDNDHNDEKGCFEGAFESNKLYDFVEYGGIYTQNVTQKRNVLYLKGQKFWIIGDYASPEDQSVKNSYEQNWNMLPTANVSYDEETMVIKSNFEDYNVTLVPVGTEGMKAYYEDTLFVGGSASFTENVKTVLQKEVTGDTVFNTIVLPRNLNEDFDVEARVADTGLDPDIVNAFVARIKNKLTGSESYYYYYHLNDTSKKQKVNVGKFATDATTMLVETDVDGNTISTFLMDATVLEDISREGKVLFYSKSPIDSIAYETNGQVIYIYSSTITDEQMKDITIYAPNQFNARLESGFVDGKKSGAYLYFGDEPVIDGSEDEENDKPSGGSSGGGGGGSSGGLSHGGTASVTAKDEVTVPEKDDDVNTEEPEIPETVLPELEGHWGAKQIMTLYNDGIVTGDKTGLRLKDTISRAEFVTLMVRALGLEVKEYTGTFNDVTSYNWYANYIATAFDAGLVNGSDGMFRPNDTITREEICKIIASATDVKTELKPLDFSDNDKISNWAKGSVQKAYSLGILNGMGDGSFAPKSNALREQAFVMLARFIEVNKK